jgi:hypothetical protein
MESIRTNPDGFAMIRGAARSLADHGITALIFGGGSRNWSSTRWPRSNATRRTRPTQQRPRHAVPALRERPDSLIAFGGGARQGRGGTRVSGLRGSASV